MYSSKTVHGDERHVIPSLLLEARSNIQADEWLIKSEAVNLIQQRVHLVQLVVVVVIDVVVGSGTSSSNGNVNSFLNVINVFLIASNAGRDLGSGVKQSMTSCFNSSGGIVVIKAGLAR